jgi:hypothetical protein
VAIGPNQIWSTAQTDPVPLQRELLAGNADDIILQVLDGKGQLPHLLDRMNPQPRERLLAALALVIAADYLEDVAPIGRRGHDHVGCHRQAPFDIAPRQDRLFLLELDGHRLFAFLGLLNSLGAAETVPGVKVESESHFFAAAIGEAGVMDAVPGGDFCHATFQDEFPAAGTEVTQGSGDIRRQ